MKKKHAVNAPKKVMTLTVAATMALSSTSPFLFRTIKAATSTYAKVEGNKVVIGNDYMTRTLSIADGKVKTVSIDNKRANKEFTPADGSEDFQINTIDNGEKDDTPKEEIIAPTKALNREGWNAKAYDSAGNEKDASNLLDGNKDSILDFFDGVTGGTYFDLILDLGEAKTFQSLGYDKRPGYGAEGYGMNGTIKGYELYVSDNGTDWNMAGSGEFSDTADYHIRNEDGLYYVGDTVYANFDKAYTTQYVKVRVLSTYSGSASPDDFSFTGSEINLFEDKKTSSFDEKLPTAEIDPTTWKATLDGKDASKIIDGCHGTVVSSKQNKDMIIDLGSEQKVSSFSYQKRQGYPESAYGKNGTTGKYTLYVSDDGTNWAPAGSGEFSEKDYNLHEVIVPKGETWSGDGKTYPEGTKLYNVGDLVYGNFDKEYTTRYVKFVSNTDIYGFDEFNCAEFHLYSDAYQKAQNQDKPTTSDLIKSSDFTLSEDGVKIEDTQVPHKSHETSTGKKVTFDYEPIKVNDVEWDVTYVIVMGDDDHYMRSYIELTADDHEKAQIDYIDMDHFVLDEEDEGIWSHPDLKDVSSMWIRPNELMLGQPIYVDGLFMGSEFPAADTDVVDDKTQIRYYSGKTFEKLYEDGQLSNDGKFVSWQNVIGAAKGTSQAMVQTDFYEYIEDIATPTDFRKQYNSWYDNMMSITDESIASSFLGAEAGLNAQGVEPLDSYVVDDGWNNYYDGNYTGPSADAGSGTPNQTGFWEFNNKFPNELYTSSALSSKLQSTFGVWVGPQGGYNFFNTFAQYLESMGTGYVQSNSALGKVVCTGSHKYQKNFTDRFVDYQQRFNIDYWKWDGFASRPCNDASHDHMTGGTNDMYFTSDMWEGWTNVFEAVRAARADEGKGLWINATCYINLSPWLLQWVNTIWVQDSGDTGVLGTGKTHERKIYYRDNVYFNLYKRNQVQFPLKNIYNHDPIFGVSDQDKGNPDTEEWRDYLFANAARGTAFWELYFSPSMFKEAHWQVTADVLDFAENNFNTLKNAKLFGDRPSENGAGDGVYGYSAWDGNHGVVSFVNSTDQEMAYELTLNGEVGVPSTMAHAAELQVLPYQGTPTGKSVSYGDTITVTLAPHEVRMMQYGNIDTSAPVVTNVKNTGNKTIRVSFDKRVNDDASFTIEGNKITSAVLMDDYRTYELTTEKELGTKDVEIKSEGLKSTAGTSFDGNIALRTYEDGIIVSVAGDKLDPITGNYTMDVNGTKKISDIGIKGTGEFGISFNIKTTDTDKTLLTQGNDIKVSIDKDGYLVANIGSQSLTSKETVTTVIEKAHGLFNTDAYVETSTEDLLEGNIADGELHSIVITREANGVLKLYENGMLRTSAYDDGKKDDIKDANVVLGSNNLKAVLGNVEMINQTISYDVAQANANAIVTGDESRALNRNGWTATACSEMPEGNGDSNAAAAIDGNMGTWWHSNYNGQDDHDGSNHYIAIDFGKEETFSSFELTGRAGSNGDVSKYHLYAMQNGEWVKIVDNGEFDTSSAVNTVSFDEITATGVKLEYIESVGGFAAAKEINVLSKASPINHDAVVKAASNEEKAEESNYSKTSYKAYLQAFNKLMDLVEATKDTDTTNFVLQDILDDLASAKASLVDVTSLRTAINNLKEELKKTDIYSANSITEAKKLIARVEVLLDDGSKDTIEQAVVELNEFKLTVKGDVTSLKALIADWESKNPSDYTEKTWNDFNAVLEEAKKVANDENVTDAMIEAAISSINDSKDTLAMIKPIEDAIKAYEAKLSDNTYTPASITAAKEAFNQLAIEDVKKNGTKEEVASIVDEIQNIYFTKKANKDALHDAIAEAQKNVDSENYTEASREELAKAIKALDAIVKDENATQKDVDQAVKELHKVALIDITALKEEMQKFKTKMGTNALIPNNQKDADALYQQANALQKDGTKETIQTCIDAMKSFKFEYQSDKSVLESAINTKPSLDKEAYTTDSWNAYQKALENANKIYKDENATSDQIANAIDTLLDARANLKEVEKPSDQPNKDEMKKPDTGDHTNTGILFGGMMLSGAAIALLMKKRRDSKAS